MKCIDCRNIIERDNEKHNSRGDCYICRDCNDGSKKVKECEKYKQMLAAGMLKMAKNGIFGIFGIHKKGGRKNINGKHK